MGNKHHFKVGIDTDFVFNDHNKQNAKYDHHSKSFYEGLSWIASSKCDNCHKFGKKIDNFEIFLALLIFFFIYIGLHKTYSCELSSSCILVNDGYEYLDNYKLRFKGKRYKEMVTI